MDIDYLLKTASKLTQVSNNSSDEYAMKFDSLLSEINSVMLSRPDIKNLVGDDNLDMMRDNHANHLRFMKSMFKFYVPHIYVETILWVFRAYRSHGFTTNYWATQINSWIVLLKKNLSVEAYSEIIPYYEWIQVNIPTLVKISDSQLNLPNPLH